MYVCILFGLSTSTLSTTMFHECWYFIRFSTLARSLTAIFLYVGILFHSSHFIAAMFYVCCILFGLCTALVLCICLVYWGGGGISTLVQMVRPCSIYVVTVKPLVFVL